MLKEVVETFNIGASYIIGHIFSQENQSTKYQKFKQKIKLNITECDKL